VVRFLVNISVIWMLFARVPLAMANNVRHELTGVVPLRLTHGINHISDFDGNGHDAEIIYAWRENMNAHGYGVYSVLMLRPDTKDDWNLVTFEMHDMSRKDGTEVDSLYDVPFDGEEVVASVRFLKTVWNGKPATLAITARRDLSKAMSFIDRTPVAFSIYQLVANTAGTPGWPFYYFDRIDHFISSKYYCNSDLALTKELRLPLPDDYAGSNNDDGCIR